MFDPLWCHKGPLLPSVGSWQQLEKAPVLVVGCKQRAKGDIFLLRVMNLNLFRSSSSLQDGTAGHDVTKGHCSVTAVTTAKTEQLWKSATFNPRLMKPKRRRRTWLDLQAFHSATFDLLARLLWMFVMFRRCRSLVFLVFLQCTTAIGFHWRFPLTPPAGQIHEPTLKFSLIVSNEALHVFLPKWTSVLIVPEGALHPLQVFKTSLIYFIQNQIYSQISISITTSQPITTQNSPPPPFFPLSSRLLQTSCWDDFNFLDLI